MKLIYFSFIFILTSCKNNNIKKKKIGDNIVEAIFKKNGEINGEAKFYNLNNVLEARSVFIKGIKNGLTITYHNSGKVQDSMLYVNGYLHGIRSSYNTNGSLVLKTNYFYGLNMGDNLYYNKGKLTKYSFDNFEHNHLLEANYDSTGSCEYLRFNAKPIIAKATGQYGDSGVSLLLYFPHPPDFDINYTLGLINENGKKKNQLSLNSYGKVLIDTVLSIPPINWKYFLSIDYKNLSNDTLINQFFGKF